MTALALASVSRPGLRVVTPVSAASAEEADQAGGARPAFRVLRGGQDAAAGSEGGAAPLALASLTRRPVTPRPAQAVVSRSQADRAGSRGPASGAVRGGAVVDCGTHSRGAGARGMGTGRLGAAGAQPAVRVSAQAASEVAVRRERAASAWYVLPAGVRRALVVSLVLVVVTALASAWMVGSVVMAAPEAGASVTVQAGESLWDIASATGSADVAETMAQIARLNGLEGSVLQPGQVLVLPAE